jgi:Spy/CpxP family protein refolding chaperone
MKKLNAVLAGALLTTASFATFAAAPSRSPACEARWMMPAAIYRKKRKRWAPATTVLSASITQATPVCGAAPQRFIASYTLLFPSL